MNFDAPVPGESLTETPGNAAWEHPPQFTKLQDAMNFVYTQMMRPRSTQQLIAMLDARVPAEAIAKTVLFTGFAQGQWTPDLMILMAKPVIQLIVAIGTRAGVKVKIGMPNRYKKPAYPELARVKAMTEPATEKNLAPVMKVLDEAAAGLMARPTATGVM